jgi:hypothetical protein
VPAWTRLWFYAPHKMVLTDPGLGSVIEGKAVPCEFAEPGDPVNDYVLSKFQSKKAGGESYGSIQSTLGQAAVKSTHNQGVSQFSAEERQKRGYIVYPKDIIEKYQEYDILTIRNRRFTPDPKLSDVLSRLFTHNRKYANIHCSFCRVSTWAIRYESWDAETWTAS